MKSKLNPNLHKKGGNGLAKRVSTGVLDCHRSSLFDLNLVSAYLFVAQ
jgi:hypothetical protein